MSFRSDISKVLKLLGDERRNYTIGLSSLLVLNMADVLAPLFMAVAVDLTEAALNETAAQTPPILAALGVSATSFTIFTAVAVFLVLRVIANVLRYPMLMYTAVPSWRIAQTLRNRLVGKLLDLSPAFYDRAKSGDLMSIATADLLAVRMMVGPAVLVGADTFSLITFVLLVLFALSWKLTLIVLIPLPIIAFITSKLSKAEYSRFRAVQEDIAKLTERARESYAGVRVLKGFAREAFDQARFEKFSEHHYDLNLSLAKVRSVFEPTLFLMVGISTSLVLIFGGIQVVNGTLSVGTFLAFIFLVNYLSWPMVGFGWTVSLIQRGRASLTRLEGLDAEPIEVFDRPTATETVRKADIELRNLTFTYPVAPDQDDGTVLDEKLGDSSGKKSTEDEPPAGEGAAEGAELEPVLRDVSLRIPAGTTLGVVGPVGSGKSTLAKMLVRLYEPPEGTVFVGDDDVRDLTLTSLRERIVIAPQDTFLFSDTVGNNVILASDDGDDPTKYTRLTEVHEEIDGLKKGYGTLLGERGVNLSGGQRQRVAIARAIAADPEVLVLDDCLSAIDANTEDAILAHLREIFEGRSGIIISHRVRAVQACDQIVVLEDGRVSELGSHQELLQSGGYYSRMAEEQMDTEGANTPTEPSPTGPSRNAQNANDSATSEVDA